MLDYFVFTIGGGLIKERAREIIMTAGSWVKPVIGQGNGTQPAEVAKDPDYQGVIFSQGNTFVAKGNVTKLSDRMLELSGLEVSRAGGAWNLNQVQVSFTLGKTKHVGVFIVPRRDLVRLEIR
ncbi:MAG TPA: hypothetical protein VLI92_00755 [Candidatus Saccharimonadales bacterium]|nr:hypothetical protein [Candidatus Saccharimonadales bacterium]